MHGLTLYDSRSPFDLALGRTRALGADPIDAAPSPPRTTQPAPMVPTPTPTTGQSSWVPWALGLGLALGIGIIVVAAASSDERD